MKGIIESVNDYVKCNLANWNFIKVRAPKMIHDTIHGSNFFYAHEISVLDLPIIQRLRYISQVDLASFVFPSANHNRFEHTLGVTAVAGKLIKALRDKVGILMTKTDEYNIRMAAIMHDCGHGPLSHMSEEVYRSCKDIKSVMTNEKLHDRKPHEVLSYLIVTSEEFTSFIKDVINPTYGVNLDVQIIGNMIIGWSDDPAKYYLSDIINGPYDADKLDYIQRDSHFTGIKMVLDLDRLFYTVCTLMDDQGRIRLSVDSTGVSTLEQIMFNKMMLYSTVYHHHKVRAAECVFKSIVETINRENKKVKGRGLSKASNYLYMTDHDIYCINSDCPSVKPKLEMLRNRLLMKRALVISKKTMKPDSIGRMTQITKLYEVPEKIPLLREAIYKKASVKCNCTIDDIWVDIPKPPSFKEGSDCLIKLAGTDTKVRLRDMFPSDEWATAFTENKYQGYVFCPSSIRNEVHDAAKQVFYDAFEIEFNDYAKTLCKMNDELDCN